MTTNDHFSPLFEITDYLDPPGVVFVAHEARANQPRSHAGHTSVTHALTKAHSKKSLNQCATVAHYPQGTPMNPLDSVSKKEERIVGSPNTPEKFQKLPSVLRYHHCYNKPDVQRMLKRFSFTDLS